MQSLLPRGFRGSSCEQHEDVSKERLSRRRKGLRNHSGEENQWNHEAISCEGKSPNNFLWAFLEDESLSARKARAGRLLAGRPHYTRTRFNLQELVLVFVNVQNVVNRVCVCVLSPWRGCCHQILPSVCPDVHILIGVGAVMMFVGFLGCYGAIQESQCLLGTVSHS